jgi:hypothetical protein
VLYHLLVGINAVYAYDITPANEAHMPRPRWIQQLVDYGLLHIVPWPVINIAESVCGCEGFAWMEMVQVSAINHYRYAYGPRAQWMAVVDLDEFIEPLGNHHGHLEGLLQEYAAREEVSAVCGGALRWWPNSTAVKDWVKRSALRTTSFSRRAAARGEYDEPSERECWKTISRSDSDRNFRFSTMHHPDPQLVKSTRKVVRRNEDGSKGWSGYVFEQQGTIETLDFATELRVSRDSRLQAQ